MAGEGKAKAVISGQIALPIRAAAGDARVYLATPAYGSAFSAEYVQSLFRLMTAKRKRAVDFKFSYFDFADVVTARNYLISDFFYNHADCTHLLFIDDDMGYEPALIGEMLDLGEPLAGTIYPKRRVDLRKLHAAKDVSFEKALAGSVEFLGEVRKPLQGKGKFISVNHCGTGIMLISRGCVQTMIEKLPGLVDEKRFRGMPFGERFTRFITPFDKIKTDEADWSEDYSFCRRWVVDCGGKIWAHASADIRHAGRMTVNAKFSER